MIGTKSKSLLVGLAVSAALAGCASSHPAASSQGSTSSSSSSSSSAPSSTAPASTSSTAPTSVPPTSSAGTGGPDVCASQNLTGAIGSPNGAAGTIYYELVLTNSGSATCTMYGYPGVSFVTGSAGQQVGAPASRATAAGTEKLVTLAPGQSAYAQLAVAEAGNYGTTCQITPTDGLRVYPPGDTTSILVTHNDQACANTADVTLHVGPVTAQ